MEKGNKMDLFKFSPLQKLDQLLIDQLEKLKDVPQFQKTMETYGLLEEKQQTIVHYALLGLTIIFPLMILMGSYLFYSGQKSKLHIQEEIITKASKIIAQKKDIRSVTSKVFGISNFTSQSALNTRLASTLTSVGIDANKVKFNQFNNQEKSGIAHITANIQFRDFSDLNLYSLLQALTIKQKFTIQSMNIEKNSSKQLLSGVLKISYHYKLPEKK